MKKRNKGQIAILIALSFSFVFLLLAMIVNIGFLVATKVNLQNSVDLAAYAGAAQQARYLTEIGKWNYEMRRNYKAFVYDYQVVFNTERKGYDQYIKNNQLDPKVCCSLERQLSKEDLTQGKNTCQFESVQDFTQQQKTASVYAGQALAGAILVLGSSAQAKALAQAISAMRLAVQTKVLQRDYSAEFDNYFFDQDNPANPNNKYNYNLRLIGWTVHDYRHIQARIRGVHTGNLNIENRLITPDFVPYSNEPVVFNNAPISVAAKVINGFTDLDTVPENAGKIIPLDQESNSANLKNPMHNAAYHTFRKNLLKAVANGKPQLFHMVPNENNIQDSLPDNSMGNGCQKAGGACQEFTGPYMRLTEHNVHFMTHSMNIMHVPNESKYTTGSQFAPIYNFPVGVAKDARVKTYYALIAAARVADIPFNVFFGSDDYSKNPALVAVSAARPFGSRIGPYVNNNCPDLTPDPSNSSHKAQCLPNGLDPLYPSSIAPTTGIYINRPNFSVLKENDQKGVRYTVGNDEYKRSADPDVHGGYKTFPDSFYDTVMQAGRWRYYFDPTDKSRDDGFKIAGGITNDKGFYDHENMKVHPHGCRNSIMAWNSATKNATASKIPDVGQQNHYEAYLKYMTQGNKGAVAQLPHQNNRTRDVNGALMDYNVYVFRYPGIVNNNWDILKKTKGAAASTEDGTFMEKSFANTMAVNEFEIYRYIIPNQNNDEDDNVILNWTVANNKEGYVFAGNPLHGVGSENFRNNILFDEYAAYEGDDILYSDQSENPAESYSSWRIGLRGYRVKLINIKEIIEGNENFKNPVGSEQTISYEGDSGEETIRIDLSKIYY
ncbi:MAG: hypothetical protein JXA66_07200 [Oligoflexia bacterium]|nr:hypothetical protein [Oligoflexia bacterium]